MVTSPPVEPAPTMSVGDVQIRIAHDDELDAAGSVVLGAYDSESLAHDGYRAVLSDARDRAQDAEVVVAIGPDGDVLGCVTFALPGSRWAELSGPGEAEFRMLGVRPDARGRGLAAALVEWCVTRARQCGATRLVICSQREMSTAHRLYDRRGFARRPDLDWSPVPGIDLLGFALDLPPSHPPTRTPS